VENAGNPGISSGKRSTLVLPKFSVAPMMDWTDRHCRVFLRCFSPRALLYTEMITAAAILRGDRARLLRFAPQEQPVALQLGGSEPQDLAIAARAGEDAGYREINLNCGCPSDRVSSGSFGACLMEEPQRVADCVAAMHAAVRIPVTVKMRIGVVDRRRAGEGGADVRAAMLRFDDQDYGRLEQFTRQIVAAGCAMVIVHARKAVLGGLSPHENRTVPPLRFEVARRLREAFPDVAFAVNGGIRTAEAALAAAQWCDSVMIGREAYHRPALLAELHAALYPDDGWAAPSPQQVLATMQAYAADELAGGERLSSITRHMLGLVSHTTGARDYRRLLAEGARSRDAGPELLERARAVLDGLVAVPGR
jgi:tRNA-dihydrouridine synthase A